MNNSWFSKVAVWMVIAMVLFTVFKQFEGRTAAGVGNVGYSEFIQEVQAASGQRRFQKVPTVQKSSRSPMTIAASEPLQPTSTAGWLAICWPITSSLM